MKLKAIKPEQALKSLLKFSPRIDDINKFKKNLISLLDKIKKDEYRSEDESEEHLKNDIRDFLRDTYYIHKYAINTKDKKDLVIHLDKSTQSKVAVIIETKRPSNITEMISIESFNKKAFQEVVLYYFDEVKKQDNNQLKYLIITNIHQWFIIDVNHFDNYLKNNKAIETLYQTKVNDRKNNPFFYEELAKILDKIEEDIPCINFDILDYEKVLKNEDLNDDKELIHLYKILSPKFLLKLPYANDSNSLDKKFYHELLHIIGLEEEKVKGKKIIRRKNKSHSGSIIEDTIIQLDSLDKLSRLRNASQYGSNSEDRLYNVALELAITWINRILFLKLLEGQLLNYNKASGSDDKDFEAFLNYRKISSYDELNNLFFQVLAKKHVDRSEDIRQAFAQIPYLNSSLFEPTEMEHTMLFISNLSNDKELPIYTQTVLKDQFGKARKGSLKTLEYLFEFLDAYDFGGEDIGGIREKNKTLINASVLGLIFEKINGYKDGSFFTPGFITEYMCRETIRKSIVQKFNETKGWNCRDFGELKEDLKNEIYESDRARIEVRKEANQIVNSLKICDPAVGSGHFLVSALNELISIKSELKILVDDGFQPIESDWNINVENDELTISRDGRIFEYNHKNKESQLIQKTLFHEKQTLIENCLFGVDINPNSVKICRLRLWIELLKNAYYKNETELETLPNIDINIKCGNSLVSRFSLDADLSQALKNNKNIQNYKLAVSSYRNAKSKEEKREFENLIDSIKSQFKTEILSNDPKLIRLRKLEGEIFLMLNQKQIFEMSKKEKAEWNNKVEKLSDKVNVLKSEIEEIKANKIYESAFEWRFEFPEVLNDEGDFVGFDVVIGNPPYIKEYEGKHIFDGLRENEVYQGKMDIWYMFLADGIKILKEKGLLNFIAPNNWVTNAGASKVRNFMLENSQFIQLIDFNNYMVFDTASIQTMIMQFSKTKSDNYSFDYRKITTTKPVYETAIEIIENKSSENIEILNPKIILNQIKDKSFTFNSNVNESVLEKIISKSNFKLGEKEVANGIHPHHDFINKKISYELNNKFKIGDGIFGLSNQELESLNLLENEKELIKPYFTSDQFSRYYASSENKLWLIYTSSKFKNPEEIKPYPNIKKHLDQFQSVITSDNKPYGLHRTREERFFKGEKIITLRKCAGKPVFTYTNFDTYVSATFYVIKTERLNQKYLTGLLNSTLIEFWLKNKGKMQGNNFQLDKEPLIDIPLIEIPKPDQQSIIEIVNQILALKKEKPTSDTTDLEAKIDQLVYQLYELTEEEIAIVEGSVK
jgi:adenine-specific DNA-methyltransferase